LITSAPFLLATVVAAAAGIGNLRRFILFRRRASGAGPAQRPSFSPGA
jgi:hypothetical protein